MKKLYTLLVLCICTTVLYAQKENELVYKYDKLDTIIKTVQDKYIPDKNIEVFDINVSNNEKLPTLQGITSDTAAYNALITMAANDYGKDFVNNIKLLPDTALGDKTYGVITLSVADMRLGPDFSAEMATQSLLGTPIRILQKNRWSRVQTPDGYIIWTQNVNYKAMTKQEYENWKNARKIIFTQYYGFSYSEPNIKSQTVSDLVCCNILKFEGEKEKFFKVSYPDGRIAYVLKNQSKHYEDWLASINVSGEDFIKKGFTLMGIPYVWGGTSVKGMDCSGFTKTVALMHGIILMRNASQQAYTGIPVDISNGYGNLKPGDLMFFGKKAENGKKEHVRHVAFYIGNNKFIHSLGYVHVSSLNPADPEYDESDTKEFIRAARIIGAVDKEGSGIRSMKSIY